MAAITIDSPRWREGWGETRREGWAEPITTPVPRPTLRLVGPGSRRPDPSRLRRRRMAAVAVLVLIAGLALAIAATALARPATSGSAPVGRQTYVVEAGDTYWSIASGLGDEGDLRVAVDALIDANGGRPLFAGDRIELP